MSPTKLAPGYPPELVALDARMVALGRPLPPAVAFHTLSAAETRTKPAWDAACATWRAELGVWESEHPESALEWAALNEEYYATWLRIEESKVGDAKVWWTFERLKRLGAPAECVDVLHAPRDEPALKKARDFWYDGAWCLLLLGGPGSGKTTAAAWLALQYTTRGKPHVQWVDCTAQSVGQLFGAEADVKKHMCREADALVLDDVFHRRLEVGATDRPHWLEWLDAVIGYRMGGGRKTVITSNSTLDEFKTRIGPRLWDRIGAGMVFGSGAESMR